MPIDHDAWRSIDRRIDEKIAAQGGPAFVQGVVIKTDIKNNLIWLQEFGDQPIPLFTFDYDIKYYDTQPVGNVTSGSPVPVKVVPTKAVVTPKCPKVGDIVLVAQQYGSRRLPKCLGVLRSRNFIIPQE